MVTSNYTRDYRFTNEPVVIGANKIVPGTKLTVGGVIAAREIKVSADAGADFVFEQNYKLPELIELEKFVKANKHLPGIPAASEMIENGVNLGELNIKLLQKVEELTLYLIEKNNSFRTKLPKAKDSRHK